MQDCAYNCAIQTTVKCLYLHNVNAHTNTKYAHKTFSSPLKYTYGNIPNTSVWFGLTSDTTQIYFWLCALFDLQ